MNRRHRRHWPDHRLSRQQIRQRGHDVVAASPQSGVNTITGQGLRRRWPARRAVIDLAVRRHLKTRRCWVNRDFRAQSSPGRGRSGRPASSLSIVAIDRTDNGYFRAKVAQENSKPPASPTRSCARPSSWNFSAASPIQARLETQSGFRPSCSSPSRRMTSPPSSPRRRWLRRETASSRSPARSERRSSELVARYLKAVGDPRS